MVKSSAARFGAGLATVLVSLLVATRPALAADKNPCADDVARLCKDSDRGAIRDCMREHESDLSPACRQHLEQRKQHYAGAREACQNDIKKFCSDVKRGEGRIADCMRQHASELEPACKAKLHGGGSS